MSEMNGQENQNGQSERNGHDEEQKLYANGSESEGEEASPSEDPNEELAKLAEELAEQKDRHLRALAEMDNMRRRLERERTDLIKYGNESFVKDLLPVLDSLEKALPDSGPHGTGNTSEESSYLSGMMMVKKQLLDVLAKHGLEPVAAAGKPFDPNLHQAIQRVESKDVTADTVKDEYARGYLLHGRLLRPAMVSVLTPSN